MARKPSYPSRPCPKCGKPIHIKSKSHEACGWTANGAVTAKTQPGALGAASDETTGGYFRRLFQENPKWLKGRSNDEVLNRWLTDHPGHKVVPGNIKAHLSNVKSTMRSKKRRRVAQRTAEPHPNGAVSQPGQATSVALAVKRKPTGTTKLDELEYQIDECLILAKHMDRDALHEVISHLRRARNAVVWMIGQ
jgi:hypothetical protein